MRITSEYSQNDVYPLAVDMSNRMVPPKFTRSVSQEAPQELLSNEDTRFNFSRTRATSEPAPLKVDALKAVMVSSSLLGFHPAKAPLDNGFSQAHLPTVMGFHPINQTPTNRPAAVNRTPTAENRQRAAHNKQLRIAATKTLLLNEVNRRYLKLGLSLRSVYLAEYKTTFRRYRWLKSGGYDFPTFNDGSKRSLGQFTIAHHEELKKALEDGRLRAIKVNKRGERMPSPVVEADAGGFGGIFVEGVADVEGAAAEVDGDEQGEKEVGLGGGENIKAEVDVKMECE
ncbi:hypothetical protein BJ508DRAFT_331804 [Ascobolus immersus RN42]|uniref:Uncharacterized protein n=1 Tax=Ascobolus immersus RN42 TaxID=1160509 RepID=A0A3N4HR61_ASCIM|nr:hypothetical protein BJ508DRAFT_331804 [Ascobolus immersus RN42]